MEQLKKEVKRSFDSLVRRLAALALAAAMVLSLTGCEPSSINLSDAAGALSEAAEAASGLLAGAADAASGILTDAAGAAAGGAESSPAAPTDTAGNADNTGGSFKMSFIDVGQALSVLVECDGQFMLYDGGNVADGSLVVNYLLGQGVQRLEYVFGSHAHEDHIGGLSAVLENIEVGHVYSPVTEDTGDCFNYFASDAAAAGHALEVPAVGTVWQLGSATVRLLGPLKAYEDANNTSLVLRIGYGKTSFLLTGDMEREAELDLLDSGADLKADVLQVGHHGSSSSTSYVFLNDVLPNIAVISCGANNDYGHPHEEVLSRLRDADAAIYRTDLMGTVTVVSDGTNCTASYESSGDDMSNADGYIGNVKSKKFHLPSCADLPAEQNRIFFSTYSEAVEAGYTPHSGCVH